MSEWDTAGNRVATSAVQISPLSSSIMKYSLRIAAYNIAYLYNQNTSDWHSYHIGIYGRTSQPASGPAM